MFKLSNLCVHLEIGESLLKSHQEKLFRELSDLVLILPEDPLVTLIHESSVSFFYNMISAYHLESHVIINESHFKIIILNKNILFKIEKKKQTVR